MTEFEEPPVDGQPTMYVKAEKRARRAMSATQWTDTAEVNQDQQQDTDYQRQMIEVLKSIDTRLADNAEWMAGSQRTDVRWMVGTLGTIALIFIVFVGFIILRSSGT